MTFKNAVKQNMNISQGFMRFLSNSDENARPKSGLSQTFLHPIFNHGYYCTSLPKKYQS